MKKPGQAKVETRQKQKERSNVVSKVSGQSKMHKLSPILTSRDPGDVTGKGMSLTRSSFVKDRTDAVMSETWVPVDVGHGFNVKTERGRKSMCS